MAPETGTVDQDALLAELAGVAPGGTAGLAAVDADRLPQPKAADPLVVAPGRPKNPSALKASDAVHATAAGGKGYKMVVEGEYTVPLAEGGGKTLKRYRLSFNVPDASTGLSLILKSLLIPKLQRKDPKALGYRTHKVVSCVPLSDEVPAVNDLRFMDRERLVRFIQDNDIPLDPSKPEYSDTEELRASVVDYKLNPDGPHAKTTFAQREARKLEQRTKDAELLAMNPELRVAAQPDVVD